MLPTTMLPTPHTRAAVPRRHASAAPRTGHLAALPVPSGASRCRHTFQKRQRVRAQPAGLAGASAAAAESESLSNTQLRRWSWRQPGGHTHSVAYAQHGTGPVPLVLVHGMGACHEHYNKLVHELDGDVYTIYVPDLLGFGDSDKPLPAREAGHGHLYSYATWAAQIRAFIDEVVEAPAVVVGNSAGGLAALQVAAEAPQLLRGLLLLDCSMRQMHEANQPLLMRPFIAAFQWLLRDTPVGRWAVQAVLDQPKRLKRILQGAYGQPDSLSPELFRSFQRHLHDPTSCDVLLDVFTNSQGPLPQDFLPLNTVPTVVLWGAADAWEPATQAQKVFEPFTAEFIALPGVGHFPQDEVPALVAAMLSSFVEECAVEALYEGGGTQDPGRCQPGAAGGFTLRGLMAAAELDAKV